MKTLFILLLLPIIFYVLYINGYLVFGSKRAKVFVGKNRGTKAYWIQFVECSGELKRVVKFRKSKEYHFLLNANVAEGAVKIEIWNKEKEVVLSLTPEQPEGSLVADKKNRYYMVYQFESASGAYELTWE